MVTRILGWLLALFGVMCLLAAGAGYFVWGYKDAPLPVNILAGVGVLQLGLWLVLDWKSLSALGKDQTVGRSAMSGVIVLAIAAIASLVNVAAYRYDKRWDLTNEQQFTLSAQSKDIVKALDREIAVTAFFQSGSPQEQNFKQLMQSYTDETTLLKVEFHDPYANPLLAEQMKIMSPSGTVILKVGENQQRLETDFDEEAVTNAVVKVTRERSHAVCVVQGHGELDLQDDQSPGGLGVAMARLEGQNYKTSAINLLQVQPTPDTCEVVVLAGPRAELVAAERDRLARFVAAGGGLVVMLDPLQTPETAADMVRYGVKVGNDVVVEADPNRMVAANDPTALGLDSTSWDIHPVTQKLTGLVILSMARSVGKGDDVAGLNVQVVAQGSANGWAETKLDDPNVSSEPTPGVDIVGNVPLIVSVDVADPANLRTTSASMDMPSGAGAPVVAPVDPVAAPPVKAGGKVMVFGDGDFASNLLVLKVQNQDLFLNTVAWMVGEKDQLSIRANKAQKGKLELTELSVFGGAAMGLLLIPGLCFAGMIGTWLLRRGK